MSFPIMSVWHSCQKIYHSLPHLTHIWVPTLWIQRQVRHNEHLIKYKIQKC